MAVTGLLLFGFVVAHMLGNLQIFFGRDVLNGYAEKLKDMPGALWTARLGLLTVFGVHIVAALRLAREYRAARPVPYVREETIEASYASRTMVLSGLVMSAGHDELQLTLAIDCLTVLLKETLSEQIADRRRTLHQAEKEAGPPPMEMIRAVTELQHELTNVEHRFDKYRSA